MADPPRKSIPMRIFRARGRIGTGGGIGRLWFTRGVKGMTRTHDGTPVSFANGNQVRQYIEASVGVMDRSGFGGRAELANLNAEVERRK